ncbi:hypothetical protein [Roseisolibacter sp. H3M3-2]|uniref:hypothetical protein n=1 Tax=Roseisolibacter sp. H3M3-2 TaxID=3031323 RepID=UPI0023DC2F1C|nr:hypothetical protein [Roseisolibacter sp. H3M3-2]MDF1501814.1 hypothetical protein [Roseisolibacter sp. H3M3-2]
MSEYADVTIRWLPPAEGGRSAPVQARASRDLSYRPHFRVGAAGEPLGVAFLRGEPPVVAPGGAGAATVALLFADAGVDYHALVPGAAFEVLEGARVVARGTVDRRWRAADDWRERAAG